VRRAVSKTSEEQVQKDKEMLVLDEVVVAVAIVCGSLLKETMP
jgi:phosphatidylglycerophosphatase A